MSGPEQERASRHPAGRRPSRVAFGPGWRDLVTDEAPAAPVGVRVTARGMDGVVSFDGRIVRLRQELEFDLEPAPAGDDGVVEIQLPAIATVRWRPATAVQRGFLQVSTRPAPEGDQEFRLDPAGVDDNGFTVTFKLRQNDSFMELIEEVERAHTALVAGGRRLFSLPPPPDIAADTGTGS